MAGDEVDIEALVGELREEAAALRKRIALTPRTDSARESIASVVDPSIVDRLLELSDPRAAELRSHRRRLAPLALGVKRLLRRLLTPVLDRQTSFNRRLAETLGETEAEIEERLISLTRRLAALEQTLPTLVADEGICPVDVEEIEAGLRGRHPAEERQRYVGYFTESAVGPVIELGCGKGTFLRMLCDAGVAAWGCDPDPRLVELARAAGTDARQADPVEALAACEDASLGGVVSFRFLERLPLAKVVRALGLAHQKLCPGGYLLVEARNLASLIVHVRSWALDPTLRQPLHPLTLRFLVSEAGFERPEIVYAGEVEPDAVLEGAGEADPAARNAARLNALLFAPQEYAVVARR